MQPDSLYLFTKKTQGTQVRGRLPGWVEILAWTISGEG